MRHDRMLAELGLMPVWRLRGAAGQALLARPAELSATAVLDAKDALGWVLIERALTAEEEALFANMLRAMQLRPGASLTLDAGHLAEAVEHHAVTWLWLLGDAVVPELAEALSGAAGATASPALTPPLWRGLPVFLSAQPGELLLQPVGKARLWADWCRYRSSASADPPA